MKIGLIGLQNSGKTTVFNALTDLNIETTTYSDATAEPNLAVVNVADERVDHLTKIYNPKKTVYATVEFVDFVGLAAGSAKSGLFTPASMGLIKTVDALALVLRNFSDEIFGEPQPLKDMEQIEDELIISDLILAEKRLERIKLSYKKGQKTSALQLEEKTLSKVCEHLNNNKRLSGLSLNEDEEKSIRGFQFLTRKPTMVILNSGEAEFMQNEEILAMIGENYKVIEFAGKFEMELSLLDGKEEAKAFMEDMGIKASAIDRLTRFAYDILGYISFFTVGPDEVRAWTIRKGQTALEAAGAIHSDLARGFIRAECFTYDDLIECCSEKTVREKGRFRLEGKTYIVRDGDILNIRFNV